MNDCVPRWLVMVVAAAVPLAPLRSESFQPSGDFDFYVSPTGDDRWSGRLGEPNSRHDDGPFASLSKAQIAVRALRAAEPNRNIQVALRGGVYRLEQSLVFSLDDSSTGQVSTTYLAYPGETPVISSGVPLRGWRKVDISPKTVGEGVAKQLWMTDVPQSLANVLSLYDGFEPLPRARSRGFTPPRGWQPDSAGRGPCNVFYFADGVLDRYADFHGAELLVMPSVNYEMNILPLSFVDRERRLGVTRLDASRAMGPVQFHSETMWLENRLEDLDEPGEWVFDAEHRRVILWPNSETPSDDIVAPLLSELMRMEGEIDYDGPVDRPISNLHFRGLTFAHAERLPRNGQSGWDLQHSWEEFDRPSALVRLRGAENCTLDACRFVASGGGGIRLDLHCQKNGICNCEFVRLGGVGVLLAGYGPGTKDVNRENDVVNNWIHEIGQLYWASPAIFAWQSGHNVIAHNLIHNTPYTGIVASGRIAWKRGGMNGSVRTVRWHEIQLKDPPWSWSQREPYLHGRQNRVEQNDIHDVMEQLGDGNAIYVSGTGKANLIRENFIHDIDSDHMAGAIRCDDDQEETVIEKNVIYNVRSMHQAIVVKGKNDIANNFIVNVLPSRLKIDPKRQLHGYIGLLVNPATGAKIERNIIYSPDPTYAPIVQNRTYGTGDEPRLRDCLADYNLYFCPRDLQWASSHFAAERKYGIERHSISADPRFADVGQCDLRLQKDSPAYDLGIEPIEMSHMGLRPDHPWHNSVSRSPARLAPH